MYHCSVAEALGEVNSCVESEDSSSLLQALHSQHAGLSNVQDSNALHYLTVLRAMRAAKAEVGESVSYVHVHIIYIYMYVQCMHNLCKYSSAAEKNKKTTCSCTSL